MLFRLGGAFLLSTKTKEQTKKLATEAILEYGKAKLMWFEESLKEY